MSNPTPTNPNLSAEASAKTEPPEKDDFTKTLEQATDTDNAVIQRWLLDRVAGLEAHTNPFDTESGAARERRLAELMRGIRTGELSGGIIASEMIAAHQAALDCIRRASAPDQPPAATARNTRYAHNLMWIVTRQAAVLEHWRPKQPASDQPRKIEVMWLDALPEDDPQRVAYRERHGIAPPDGPAAPADDPREDGDAPA